jgi:DNA-binding IclR family transcriptional regulator
MSLRERCAVMGRRSTNAAESGSATPAGPSGTQSSRRLLTLLDQFTAEHPTHTVHGLSLAIGVPRSTVYRLVSLLKTHGLLEEAGESRYQLGPRVIAMGYVARSMVDLADLWRPTLERLAGRTSETALVLRRIGDSAVCVDRVECDHPVRLSFEVGRAMPLHTGAGPKVLLAFSAAEYRERYISTLVPSSDRRALRAELEHIVALGWGESQAEVDPGIWATACSVMVERDGRSLAISVALPDYRLTPGRREELRAETLQAAAELRDRFAHLT